MRIARTLILSMGVLSLVFVIGFGCSSGDTFGPVSPEQPGLTGASGGSHSCWGFYQFVCDSQTETIDIIPLREAYMHLNALPFLEPPALVNLSLESLEFNEDLIEADIGLRHPFLGLDEFSGFDVSGIVISNGSYSGYSDTDINIAGPGDFYLANADGHARWWNPEEFPVNDGTMFAYNDGLLGAPDSLFDFNSTINGYKYFADGLDPDDPVTDMNTANRGLFSAGQKNIRHYTLDMGTAGLIFNYAIDACWVFPDGPSPWVAPDDFAPEANRIEPYLVDVTETVNTLWHDGSSFGGQLSLDIDIYDWYNIDQDWLRVESPGAFTSADLTMPVDGNEQYSTFHADFTTVTLDSSDDLMILITAFTEDYGFQDFIPGVTTAAYKVHYAEVSDEPSGPAPTAVADSIPLIGFTNFDGDFIGSGTIGTVTLYEWDFEGDGIYDWSSPTTGDTTHAYTLEADYDATLKASNGSNFTTDSVGIRMIDPLPVISNGNFWAWSGDPPTWDDWTLVEGGKYGNFVHSAEDSDIYKHYVHLLRTNSYNDGGQSRLTQDLNADVSEYDHLYFNVFFRLVTQSCPGDGWWAVHGGWGDFPAAVFIFYLNQNYEERFVCYGWLIDDATTQYNYVWEWDTSDFHDKHPGCADYQYEANVPLNVWQERKSIDLMSLGVDAPSEITTIWIWTNGWDYQTDWVLPWFSDH